MGSDTYTTKNIDHLGLIAGFCKEINLIELIDAHFPNQSLNKKISYGQLLQAMIVNGLGFTGRTLHMYSDYFHDKPVDRLIGENINASHITDDSLGRCLDKLYEYGVSELYQDISQVVIEHLGLPCASVNIDSTSFHVDGDYNTGDDFKGIQITKGYSRDHRPELNQVILDLITENQAGIPVYMQANNGNANDSNSFKKIVKSHIKSLKAAQKCRYLIGDAALYVADTIKTLDEQKQYFITRVPQKLKEAKGILSNIKEMHFDVIDDKYQGVWLDSDYAQVKQKWLVIHSDAAEKREQASLSRRVERSHQTSLKSFKRLCQREYKCQADAQNSLNRWQEQQDYVVAQNIVINSFSHHSAPGRPKKDAQGELYYQISAEIVICDEKVEKAKTKLGYFILSTNDCRDKLSMQQMLSQYKSQQSVERGFRFLKSPDFLTASFFLKKPERIEALLMVMTCCLMVYAGIEHQIRARLKEKGMYFPDMKKKPYQRPTARWVFYCFQGIHELTINDKNCLVVNLSERQRVIIDCLGPPYQEIYS